MDQEQSDQSPEVHETVGESHHVSFQPTPPKTHRPKWLLITVIALALCVVVGLAVAYKMTRQQRPTHMSGTTIQRTQPSPDNVGTSTDTQYTSNGNDLNLAFIYPSSWSVTPQSGDNQTDQPIAVSSPLVSIITANGSSATGRVVVRLRPGSSDISELDPGTATAAQASVQFAYTKPTSSQHQYPYLTYISLKGKTTSGGFDEVMITGVTSFVKDQPISSGSLGPLDPVITAGFFACSTQSCSGNGETTMLIANDTWQNDATCKQVQAIFASLQLH